MTEEHGSNSQKKLLINRYIDLAVLFIWGGRFVDQIWGVYDCSDLVKFRRAVSTPEIDLY